MVIRNGTPRIESGNKGPPACIRRLQVQVVEAIPVGTGGGAEYQVSSVFGGVCEVIAIRFVIIAVDQFVFGLRSTNLVVVDTMKGIFSTESTSIGSGVAAIVESVPHPAAAGKLHPLQYITLRLAGSQIPNVNFLPI